MSIDFNGLLNNLELAPEHVLRRDAARRRGALGVCPVCDLPESVMFLDPHPDAPDASCLRCGEPFALIPVALLAELGEYSRTLKAVTKALEEHDQWVPQSARKHIAQSIVKALRDGTC